jgi:hypothetical protein
MLHLVVFWRTYISIFRESFIRLTRKIAKSYYLLLHVRLSDCPFVFPHATTRPPLDGFSCDLSIFPNSVKKSQISLKSDKNKGYFTWTLIHTRWFKYDRHWFVCKQAAQVPVIFEPPCIFIIYRKILLRMRNISDKSCRANQNTHFMPKNVFR